MIQPLLSAPQDIDSFEGLIEELSLGSARGGAKRAAQPCSIEVVRPLTPEDLQAIQNAPALHSLPTIPQIRHQHHKLARLIASGSGNAEISAITGYSPTYISILRNAPDMQELVAYYAEQAEAHNIDALARLTALGLSSVEQLQERLNAEPEKFTVGQLTDLIEVGLLKPASIGAFAAAGARGGAAGIQINLNFKAPESGGSGPVIDIEASPK